MPNAQIVLEVDSKLCEFAAELSKRLHVDSEVMFQLAVQALFRERFGQKCDGAMLAFQAEWLRKTSPDFVTREALKKRPHKDIEKRKHDDTR